MFFSRKVLFYLLPGFILVGCSSSSPPPPVRHVWIGRHAQPEVAQERARELAKTTSGCSIRGVGLEYREIQPADLENPANLVSRIGEFGFNRIFIRLDRQDQLGDTLAVLINAGSAAGIPVELAVWRSDFDESYRGNAVRRLLFPRNLTLKDAAEGVARFNRQFQPGTGVAGLTVVIEPHMYTADSPVRPHGELYAWSDKTFGPGLDNEMLMRQAIAELKAMVPLLDGIPLTVSVPDFYQELVAEGKLEVGGVNDFLDINPARPVVFLRNYGNKPTETAQRVADELAAAKIGRSVLVGINIAGHISVTKGALRRRDWRDFNRAVNYFLLQWRESPAFLGVVLGPFPAIEELQLEE